MPIWANMLIASVGCLLAYGLFNTVSSSAFRKEQEAARRRGGYVHNLEAGMLSGMFAIVFFIAALMLAIITLTKLPW